MTRFGLVMTMIGVAVGLGAVWRFPYMVGRFGGAALVLVYLLVGGLVNAHSPAQEAGLHSIYPS